MVSPHKTETRGRWTAAEHERFLEAMARYPRGPWRAITEFISTRSIKQVQTHAQKYQQKLLRHQRGLQKRKFAAVFPEHRIDSSTASQFTQGCIVRKSYHPRVFHRSVPPSLGDAPSSSLAIVFSEAESFPMALKTPPSLVNDVELPNFIPQRTSMVTALPVRHTVPATHVALTSNPLRPHTQSYAPFAPVLNALEASMLLEALQTTPF